MSDGNFNRSLLPHTPYSSGLKAGKQIAKMQAVRLYKESLSRLLPHLTPEQLQAEAALFESSLAKTLN